MIWPVSCPVCGATGRLLCRSCLHSLARPLLPRCLWCGKPAPCRVHGGEEKIRAIFSYEGVMRDIIISLKHGGYEAYGKCLGEIMAERMLRPEADLLVPVPLHRESRRFYNQAESIAVGLGKVWGIGVRDAARWARNVPTRGNMTLEDRLALAGDAFECPSDLAGLRVALVDDVCTTGATLSRLARTCRAAGASVTGAFAAAHASL